MIKSYLILIIAVIVNFSSQIIFADLSKEISFNTFSIINVKTILFDLLLKPYFWLAFCFFMSSAILWVIGIKKIALAKAFSILSLNYILIFGYSFFILKEGISIYKLTSCLFIVCGVILLAQNENIAISFKRNVK
jgi:drug/metabolite transporter (DMT)-like permease